LHDVLVIVAADPTRSERALEGLRMSIGLALAENRVRLLLEGDGRVLAEPARHAFPGWANALEHLRAFRRLGGEVLAEGDVLSEAAKARVVIRWTS
jgi:hypothetical protein